MSRSNPEEKLESPCTRWCEWSGKHGALSYYDKDAQHPDFESLTEKISELKGTLSTLPKSAQAAIQAQIDSFEIEVAKKGANISLPIPFTFIVLDVLAAITGFSKENSSGIWSNEIRKKEFKTAVMNVRTKKGLEVSGLYENIKGKVAGSKYAESVYVAYLDEQKNFAIGNIKMVGSSLGSWFDYVNGAKDAKGKKVSEAHDPLVGAIVLSGKHQETTGDNTYWVPEFTPKTLKPETEAKVIELDKVLQEYLVKYFAKNASEVEGASTESGLVDSMGASPEKSAKETAMDKQLAKTAEVDPFSDNNDIDPLPF